MADNLLMDIKQKYEKLKFAGLKCRREAATLTTRAENYEECADLILEAIEEAEKKSAT